MGCKHEKALFFPGTALKLSYVDLTAFLESECLRDILVICYNFLVIFSFWNSLILVFKIQLCLF